MIMASVSCAHSHAAAGRFQQLTLTQLAVVWQASYLAVDIKLSQKKAYRQLKEKYYSRKLCHLEQFWLIMHKNMPKMCLQRMQNRNRPSDSEEKPASISRPKKSKEDLKMYVFILYENQ